MSACVGLTQYINGQPGGGSTPAVARTLWEADLTAQGNVVFADGPQNIVGTDGTVLPFTIAGTNTAQSGTVANWGFEAGVGMNYLASVTSGTFTAASQTAARLTIPHATLMSTLGFDLTSKVIAEIYAPIITFTTNLPDFGIGWFGTAGSPANSGNRMWATKRAFRVGTDVSIMAGNTGESSNYTTAPGPTANVISTMMDMNNALGMIGTWAGDWPLLDTAVAFLNPIGGTLPTINTLTGTSFAIAMANNGVAGTMRVRAARVRLRIVP